LLRLNLVSDVALVIDPALEVPRSSKVARAAGDEGYVDDAVENCEFYRKGWIRELGPGQEGLY